MYKELKFPRFFQNIFKKKLRKYENFLKLQEDLNRLTQYYISNRITGNETKCAHIQYTRRKKPLNYKLNNKILSKVNCAKDSGSGL